MDKQALRVQYITHHTSRYTYLAGARLALLGGCRWIQLRMKHAAAEDIIQVGRTLRQWCDEFGATLILDDYVSLVSSIGADGVHLGRTDCPITQARQLLGPKAILGGTANTYIDIQQLHAAGADYIGCGPLRYTTTKVGLSPLLGMTGYTSLLSQMRQEGLHLPLIAIGGITSADIAPLLHIGCHGVALSGSVLTATDPVKAMQYIVDISQDPHAPITT